MKKRESLYAFVALILVTIIVAVQMPKVFVNIRNTTFGAGGDGLKTHFTYLYHLKFDSTYLHFTGMNYPYGEHIIFTDNQPSLVIPMKAAVNAGMSLLTAQGLFNFLILSSLLLTAPIAYFLARHAKISQNFSVLIAVVLTLFSPQILRFSPHPGLSHVAFVPLVWLLLIEFFKKPRVSISLALTLLLTFFAGIHPYNLLIAVSFIFSFWLFSANNLPKRYWPHFLLQALAPIMLFGAWAKLTDPIHDRVLPETSAMFYRAYFESVFLPYEGSPLRPLIETFAGLHRELPIEAISYVGLTGFFMLIYFLIRFAREILKTKRIPVDPSLAAGILVLLYSLGYPWRIVGNDLFTKLGPISQFRALGRFAWVFFWTYSLYMFSWLAKMKRPILILAVCLTAFEAYNWSSHTFRNLDRLASEADADADELKINHELEKLVASVPLEQFQAFIPLPFFQAGSEGTIPIEVRERDNPKTFYDSVSVAYQTGLPMVAQALSRTSIRQSLAIYDFMLGKPEQLRRDLPNQKPFLLVVGPEPKMEFELKLIARATLLVKSENYQLLRLTP